jgi:release factor glutamine methyltransferase
VSEPRQTRWTVRELLTWTTERFASIGIPDARVDAEHLLAHALGCTRVQLYLQHDRLLDDDERAPFRDMIRRRLAREPVAYIEGHRGFHALDLDLAVDRRVLIPRPETEHLVDWLLESLRPPPAPVMHVLDVGTGSGAIALAVAKAREEVEVIAVDVSDDVLALARANVERLGLAERIALVRSNLAAAVERPSRGFDAIAANLPYIPTAELAGLQPEVRDHEPRLALDGGPDGLVLVRALITQVVERSLLASGGGIFLEIGIGQADAVADLLRRAGLVEVATRNDYARIPRIVAGFSAAGG